MASLERFIATRLLKSKDSGDRFSRPVVNIAITSIALGLTVMIIAVSIVRAFKNEISAKVSGFGAHIQVVKLDNTSGFETKPVYRYQPFSEHIVTIPNISHIQVFATKNVILKTGGEIQGVILKGVGKDFLWDFFAKNLVEGTALTTEAANEREIMISTAVANILKLKVGDTVPAYYLDAALNEKESILETGPRGINLYIKGIYETGMEEFDKQLVLGDLQLVQRLYGWGAGEVTGFELLVKDFSQLDQTLQIVKDELPYELYPYSIKQIYPDIFTWLPTIDVNSIVIIVLMILVGIMAMVSTLLILILEKTQLVGILKSLGMRNYKLRLVFLYHAFYILLRGLIIGNLAGIGLVLLQKYFHLIKLDQATYYLPFVPVELNPVAVILINLATILSCMIALWLPSFLVARISPVRAIRFD